MATPEKPAAAPYALLKQALLTIGLALLLWGTLRAASRNKEDFGDDEHSFPVEDFENNAILPVAAAPVPLAAARPPLPPGSFANRRTLITGEFAAILPAPAESIVTRLLAEPAEMKEPVISLDDLATAEPFERIIVTDVEPRPPRKLAQKIAKGGMFYVLKSDKTWRVYREEAGRLAPLENAK